MEITDRIESWGEELKELRRDFHRYPELAWREIRTSSKIAAYLTELGYEVKVGDEVSLPEKRFGVPDGETMEREYLRAVEQGADMRFAPRMKNGATGVIATLDCGEGPTVALRYDIDALPIVECAEASHRPAREGYRSLCEGVMHACGHDGHITGGLGTARALMEVRDKLHGKVKLIFQPAEEGCQGAMAIVNSAHLDGVDYALGAHLGGQPEAVSGVIGLGNGLTLAVASFDVDFYGRTAHAGLAPHEGHNTILAAATAIENLYAISRHGFGGTRVNVGKISGGGARNVVADHAHMECELRGTTQEAIDFMKDRAGAVLRAAAAMHQCQVEIHVRGEAGVNRNSPELVERVERICREHGIPTVTMGDDGPKASEDFAWICKTVRESGGQSCYFNVTSTCPSNVHQPTFDFEEKALINSVKTFTLVVLDLLK